MTLPLVPDQVESVMQNLTLNALGISPPDYSKVRIGWQTEGQPSQTISEDVVYIRCTEDDDSYGSIWDLESLPNDLLSLHQVSSYTRVWRVFWVAYGPNSFDNVRLIKSSLMRSSQPIHDLLVTVGLYVLPNLIKPKRVPELFQAQWWERTDFEAAFNELVRETETVNTVASVDIKVYTERSLDINHPAVEVKVPN